MGLARSPYKGGGGKGKHQEIVKRLPWDPERNVGMKDWGKRHADMGERGLEKNCIKKSRDRANSRFGVGEKNAGK